MFAKFARRMSSTQGFPYVIIAQTPNPIRQLEPEALRPRAEAMLQTVIDGLTLPGEKDTVIIQVRRGVAVIQPRPDLVIES